MVINTQYGSAMQEIKYAQSVVDVKSTLKGFMDEMSKLIADFGELSLNPDPDKFLKIGNTLVSGDKIGSTMTQYLIDDRNNKIEQAATTITDTLAKLFKLYEKTDNMIT